MKNIKIRKIISKFIKTIFYLLLVVLALYNVIYVVGHELNNEFYIPICGFGAFVVNDTAMVPELNKNNLIITKKVDEFSKNDMIAFFENECLKLRRIEKVNDNGYKKTYITKGDNYFYIDARELKIEDIEGQIIKTLKHGGTVLRILQSKGFMIFNTIVLVLMFLYNKKLEKRKMRRRKKKDETYINQTSDINITREPTN